MSLLFSAASKAGSVGACLGPLAGCRGIAPRWDACVTVLWVSAGALVLTAAAEGSLCSVSTGLCLVFSGGLSAWIAMHVDS